MLEEKVRESSQNMITSLTTIFDVSSECLKTFFFIFLIFICEISILIWLIFTQIKITGVTLKTGTFKIELAKTTDITGTPAGTDTNTKLVPDTATLTQGTDLQKKVEILSRKRRSTPVDITAKITVQFTKDLTDPTQACGLNLQKNDDNLERLITRVKYLVLKHCYL